MNYEELEKRLEDEDLYIEDIDGDTCIILTGCESKGFSEELQKLLESYTPDDDDPERIETVYDEEVERCDTCGHYHYRDRDDGAYLECEYICEDCIETDDDAKESVIDYMMDSPDHAVRLSQIPSDYLAAHGWKTSGESYETSLYATSGKIHPHDILKIFQTNHVLFAITDENPFETDWTFFTKE